MRKKPIALFTIIASLTPKLSLSLILAWGISYPSNGLEKVKKVTIQGYPSVTDDQVTVRVKVEQDNNKPMVELKKKDFQIRVDKKLQKKYDWKSPEESVPPPAWIVVLLDMSGSMNSLDSSGTSKIQGAVQAIRELVNVSIHRGGDTQISIVPFGEKGGNCLGFEEYKELSGIDKFLSARDVKLQTSLDYLASQTPCASTNIYDPLKQAVKLLGNKKDPRFHPHLNKDNPSVKPNQPQPRLSIIVLSDGYQNTLNEGQDFAKLRNILENNRESDNPIIIHTLGYGITPEQLGKKYQLGHKATRGDIFAKKVPEGEYVDQERMSQIAKITGGIAEFSADAKEVTERLELFLNSLLGEYEISYTHPIAERGSKHQVTVKIQGVTSPPGLYTITVFGRSLSLSIRLIILGVTLLLIVFGGIVPYFFWGRHLKAEAETN